MNDADATLLGIAFQILAAATGKARLPIFDNLNDSTRRLVAADRSVSRPPGPCILHRVSGPGPFPPPK